MNAPTPLVIDHQMEPEIGGRGPLVDRYSDHDADGTEHFVMLSWIDGNEVRSKEKMITLGKTGETDITRFIAPMGRYRSRQYQIVLDCAGAVGIYGLEDQVVGLGD